MLSDLYLMQGVFFQEQRWFKTKDAPAEGSIAVIRSAFHRCLYSGILEHEPDRPYGIYIGYMADRHGEASLTDVELTEERFKFTKKYGYRSDTIQYEFVRHGNLWIGKYTGKCAGVGLSRCILTPISAAFFSLARND